MIEVDQIRVELLICINNGSTTDWRFHTLCQRSLELTAEIHFLSSTGIAVRSEQYHRET